MGTNRIDNAKLDLNSFTSGKSTRGRRRPVVVVVGFTLVIAATFCVYVMFGSTPRVPLGILTAIADPDEPKGYRQRGEISAKAVMSANATSLQSTCNVASAGSTTNLSGARMFKRTLAIYNFDDDLLMQRIGLALFERLRDEAGFEQIDYLPVGKSLPDGQTLPDVVVTIDMRSWDESGLPGNRQFKGKLAITAGDQLRHSSHSYSSNSTPPQVQYRWRADIDYTAKQTGIEMSGARYQAVSNYLAKEVAGRLTKLLGELSTKYGTPGDMPEQFYPKYVEPPAFDFVAELGAEKLIDGPHLMAHTVVVWQIPSDRTQQDVIASVSRSLAKAGWTVPENQDQSGYLRATNGEQVVLAFRDNEGWTGDGDNSETPRPMYVVYNRNMSEDDIQAAVRNMFEGEADESVLLMFQNTWYQNPKLVDTYFANHSPTQSESWLQLARLRKTTDPGAAREALLCANALRMIVQQGSPDSTMKKLAEELDMEKLPQQISREMISTLGLLELTAPGGIEFTVRENELSVIYLGDESERQSWLLLTPLRKRGGHPEQTLRVQMLSLGKGSSSRSDQTAGYLAITERPIHTQQIGERERVEVFSKSANDGRSYQLTLRRSADPNVP